jgi:hypothetical protein
MSRANRAGLMVARVLLGTGGAEAGNAHAGHAHDHPAATMHVGEALLAITVHVGGMLAVITLLVYEKLGLNVPAPGVDQLRPVLGRRVHRRRHGDAADGRGTRSGLTSICDADPERIGGGGSSPLGVQAMMFSASARTGVHRTQATVVYQRDRQATRRR